MVEARDEQEAVLRASAHFRRLGHYIHEAKIFKKKDEQLNELAFVPVALGAAGVAARAALPRLIAAAARNPTAQAALRGILQNKSSLKTVARDELISSGVGYGASAIVNQILPSSSDKETSLGSIVAGRLGGGAISALTKGGGKLPPVPTSILDIVKNIGKKAVTQTTSDVAGKNLLPNPTVRPDPIPAPKPETAPAPQRVIPDDVPVTKPDVETRPETEVAPKTETIPAVVKTDIDTETKVRPDEVKPKQEMTPKSQVRPDSPVSTRTKTQTRPQSKPKRRLRAALLPGIGDRPDQDIGTLGQYRGLFPLYRFSDFESLQEASPMNAIGRVLSKRKEKNKDNAEGEKNKINMEPTLKGGKN